MNKCECGCGTEVKHTWVRDHHLRGANNPMKSEDNKRKVGEAMKVKWDDEEFRKQRSGEVKEQWDDEEYRKKMGALSKARWADEEWRAAVLAKMCTVDNRIAHSARLRLNNPMDNPITAHFGRMYLKQARIAKKYHG